MAKLIRLSFFSVAIGLILSLQLGADWLQFRGTNHSAIADKNVQIPIKWDAKKNVAWKVPLVGRGVSSPIVIGNRVVLTCCSGVNQKRLHVLCFDAKSGKQLWHRQFWATGRTLCHPTTSIAAPTPASDGKRIFAFFASNDLACLDLEGNLLWYRGLAQDYPAAGNDVAMSSSPVVIGKTVIVQVEGQGDSFATGIDVENGESRWHIQRNRSANWASPVVMRGKTPKDDVLLLQSSQNLAVHNPLTGKLLWKLDAKCAGIPSATVAGGVIYLPASGVTAVRPDGQNGPPKVLWKSNQLRPVGPSPVVYQGKIYSVNGTVMVCADIQTGKKLWQLRLAGGRYWATPIIVGDHLFVINLEGKTDVILLNAAGGKGEIVSRNQFGEKILGTPAVGAGGMFVRSDQHLWKISSK